MGNTIYTSHEQAFNDMLSFTKANESFKITFRKVNGDIKVVPKTLLRKQSPSSVDSNGAYKFNYIDQSNDTMGNAYIPLLMAVNDKQIIIK